MTDLRQAAQQALEALEGWEHCDEWVWPVSALEQSKRNTTESLAALRAALEQQQAEPPQRPWVGLTDEEMSDTVADIDVDFGDLLWKVVCLTKIIEAKLKERNT